ncbi:hypothetical protein DE146DRAFT_747730 [Phaeosphaeria sp. MPI-PUGE-AT-0046c]|nr:hypothetical protein DE146DRAFT_747730 [Phaeosphaeria sp. MPI-PUGE-AT-0046c]
MMACMLLLPVVAVITSAGGTSIGDAVAKGFARAGCSRIAITGIKSKTLDQTRDAILKIDPSAQVFIKTGDIADEKFVDNFNDETFSKFSRFSRLDYAMTADAFDQLNNVKYKESWLNCRAQIRNMGSIVNITSQLGIIAAYCASKAAIINMTRCNAIDYSPDNIRINCVCPGVVETPMTTSSKGMKEAMKPAIEIAPMKRMGTPEDISDAIHSFCSAQFSFI